MLTRAEGKAQKRAIAEQIRKAERVAYKEKLARLAGEIEELRAKRKARMRDAKASCKENRKAISEQVAALRKRALEELRAAATLERQNARAACDAKKDEVRKTHGDAIARARALRAEERKFAADLKRIEADNRMAKRQIVVRQKAERRSESDDEVRSNIAPDLAPLFEKVKRQIKASGRISRTEAFLKYAEEHPGEVFGAIEGESEKRLRALEKESARLARARPRERYRDLRVEGVPF